MIVLIETTVRLLNKKIVDFGYTDGKASLDTTVGELQEYNFDSLDLLETAFDLEHELDCCIAISNINYTDKTTVRELVEMISNNIAP